MFEKQKMVKDIMQKTSCTKEQAKYLAEELSKLPKVKDIILQHMSNMNLYGCYKVEVKRCYGYMDDWVNIAAWRVYDVVCNIELSKMYLWHFMADRPDYMGYEIW